MFTVFSRAVNDTEPFCTLPASPGLAPGTACVFAGGVLSPASGAVLPQYVAVSPERRGSAAAIRVLPTTVYAASLDAADPPDTASVGTPLCLGEGGLTVKTGEGGHFLLLTLGETQATGTFV